MERQSDTGILGHAGHLPGAASVRWRLWLALNAGIVALVVAWMTVRAGDESGTPPPSISPPPAAVNADIEVVGAVSTAIETRVDLRVGAIGDERTLPIRVANLPRLVFADGTSILARGRDGGVDRVTLRFPGSNGGEARLQLNLSRETNQIASGQPGNTAVLDLPVKIDVPYAAETWEPASPEAILGPGVAVIDRVVRDTSGVAISGHFTGYHVPELQTIGLGRSTLGGFAREVPMHSYRGGFGEDYAQFHITFAGAAILSDATLTLRLEILSPPPGTATSARLADPGLPVEATISLAAAN